MKLVSDIGGTNARFALVSAEGKLSNACTYQCADFEGLHDAVATYLSALHPAAAAISEAAVSVAMPVTDDTIRLTNNHWAFSKSGFQRRMGWKRFLVINDFAAIALSLPHLQPDDYRIIGPDVSGDPAAPMVVLGPGTGLGVAGLVPAHGHWVPVSTEGGHITLSAHDDRESEILRLARLSGKHVSAERLLSGMGLPLLHELVCAVDGRSHVPACASDLGARALEGKDAAASATLQTFFDMLGSVAGNIALSMGARGGVYLAGGILPKLALLFEGSRFRQRFVEKGRFQAYLSPIPTRLIQHENPALIGLANELQE